MATAKNPRCCNCNIFLHHTSGQRMELHNETSVENVKLFFGKDVSLGDFLCNACRRLFYEKQSISAEEELSKRSSSTESSKDPTFHVAERPTSTIEFVEIELPRVVSTHAYCFLCGLFDHIVTVPFRVRQQIYTQKRIFVPKGKTYITSNHFFQNSLYLMTLNTIHSQCMECFRFTSS